MPAPTGNSNTLKWTPEKTEKLIEKVEDLSTEENVLYLGHALAIEHTSTKQWNRLREYYADHDDFIERMDAIEQVFEARLVAGSLTGRFHIHATQFVLKNRHGFSTYKKELAAAAAPTPRAHPSHPLPPPELIYVQEAEDGQSICMGSRYGTGLEYIIYSADGDEVQIGPVIGDIQKIMITSLPYGDYHILIRGPQNSQSKSLTRAEYEDDES